MSLLLAVAAGGFAYVYWQRSKDTSKSILDKESLEYRNFDTIPKGNNDAKRETILRVQQRPSAPASLNRIKTRAPMTNVEMMYAQADQARHGLDTLPGESSFWMDMRAS